MAERDFLCDQRTFRRMVIGGIDYKVSKIIENKLKRKVKIEQRKEVHKLRSEKEKICLPSTSMLDEILSFSSSSVEDSENTEKACELITSKSIPSTSQMRIKLPNLAKACDRTGTSDRSAAILINAALTDMGLLTKEDSSKIIDRSKIRRERTRARASHH